MKKGIAYKELTNRVFNAVNKQVSGTMRVAKYNSSLIACNLILEYIEAETPEGGGYILPDERLKKMARYLTYQGIIIHGMIALHSMLGSMADTQEELRSFGESASAEEVIDHFYELIMSEVEIYGSIHEAVMREV